MLKIYQRHGNIVYLAMSTDGSCQDIRNSKDGPLLMELTEGKRVMLNIATVLTIYR